MGADEKVGINTGPRTAASPTSAAVATAISQAAMAGSEELAVDSIEGFSTGDNLLIGAGSNSETNTFADFEDGEPIILLGRPLMKSHVAGTAVSKVSDDVSSAPRAQQR